MAGGSHGGFIMNHSPLQRVGLGLAVAGAVFGITYLFKLNWLFDSLLCWLGFALTFLALSWYIVALRSVSEIRKKAREDNGNTVFVYSINLIASLAGMVAVLLLTTSKDTDIQNHFLLMPLAVLSMLTAWCMVHTQYIFEYAHEFYDEDDDGQEAQQGGLDFPGEDKPDYMDFAYFSFCMGCTFQVSDVDVTGREMRRIVMFHGLLSFFLNTFVVALTINLVAGMTQ